MILAGKSALITGAARRVGRVIALHLADRGVDVAVHYNTSDDDARDTVEEIRSRGVRAVAVQGDAADPEDVNRFIGEAYEYLDRLDILVNSAAVFPRTPFEETTAEEWDAILHVNLRGPFLCCQAAEPFLQERGGAIVNIADVKTERPRRDFIPYTVSKSGVLTLTNGLARKLAPKIRVNAIGPGPVLFPADYTEEQKEEDIRRTLLKRAGSPEDIAGAVVFLCESDYITGAFLPVDGGLHLT